jgi:Leucine-rich repeat (LRR) protein
MVKFRPTLITLACLLFLFAISHAQTTAPNQSELEDYRKQASMLVKYLEGTLNFLGDPGSTVKEKEIIINESYNKIFRDDKVQVEDDLDEGRDTPLNKDVQAYLKDVDFFFRNVSFSFDIQQVDNLVNEKGEVYFRVSLIRSLRGITVAGDSIRASRPRFVEINLDPFKKDLKIVSFYTTKLNQKEEFRLWWSNMPKVWKDYFGQDIIVYDTLPMNRIESITYDGVVVRRWKKITRNDQYFVMGSDTLPQSMNHLLFGRRPDTTFFISDTRLLMMPDTIITNLGPVYAAIAEITKTTEINISYKQQFTDLEPVSMLSELRLIDFSNTPVSNIAPLRNLNKLDAIYFSGTAVKSLDPLMYSVHIREIYCFDTEVDDLSPLEGFRQLEKLYCFNSPVRSLEPIQGMKSLLALRINNTKVNNLDPLKGMIRLRLLDFSNTAVSDISVIEGLKGLQMLNMDNTLISNINPLRNLSSLSIVQFSNTDVADLSPLSGMGQLKKVYCDKTRVSSSAALAFMRSKPGTLVIYESEELSAWWASLPIYWRAILAEHAGTSANPDSEGLHQIVNLSRLDLSGNSYLQNIQPLGKLTNLNFLSLASTVIDDISPLINLSELQEIDLSNTRISNIFPLQNILGLETLNIENTRVEMLDALDAMTRLKLIKADGSRIQENEVIKFKAKQPDALITYQTERLTNWWEGLPEHWSALFSARLYLEGRPTALQLQQLADLRELRITDNLAIDDLSPLQPLVMLETLVLQATLVTRLDVLASLKNLRKLEFPGNPVSHIGPLANLSLLEELNMENTSVSDISAIAGLTSLRLLNVSGTQIRNLKPIAGLRALEELSVYNTRLKSLSPVEQLPSVRHIKCYNTRVKKKEIDQLKANKPGLTVLFY